MSEKLSADAVELSVENIGGITETSVEFTPGVTVLTGDNATNRTSLLQGIMAVLGSDRATVRGAAEEACAELRIDGTTYTRQFTRRGGTTIADGTPYSDNPMLAELFAFLLEENEARRAVAGGGDLRELIMRPVDTDRIESRISQLESERDDVDDEIDEIASLKRRVAELDERRADVADRVAKKEDELAAVNEEIDSFGTDTLENSEKRDELAEKLDDLSEMRNRLDTVRHELETHRDSVDALREERSELEDEREGYPGPPDERIDRIEAKLQGLHSQRERTETTLDELQTVIEFNEGVRTGGPDLFDGRHDDRAGDGEITDQLLADEGSLVCWTCGSDIEVGQIDTMLDRLRDLRGRTIDRLDSVEEKIDKKESERDQLEQKRSRYDRIRTRLGEIDEEIREHEDRITDLEDRRVELATEIESVEAEVETLSTAEYGDLVDRHAEASRLELELERLREERNEVVGEIDRIEDRIAQRDQLEAQRERLQSKIEDLRTRIECLERQAVDEFNEHMDAVLDLLAFENIERIWIERTERRVRDGRRKTTETRFDLHVVRSADSGAVYEDTVEHLSESEREVTGLVFALAGYLAHDLHEDMPFMLLDSLEPLDADRIDGLITYFQDYAEYLVVALLEEDADAVATEHRRITDI